VGEDEDNPGTLACKDGVLRGEITKEAGPWSYKSASCARIGSRRGDDYEDFGLPGMSGGFCRCPNGQIFPVGDNYDKCGSLNCRGGGVEEPRLNLKTGETGTCFITGQAEIWSYKGVQCDLVSGQIPDFEYYGHKTGFLVGKVIFTGETDFPTRIFGFMTTGEGFLLKAHDHFKRSPIKQDILYSIKYSNTTGFLKTNSKSLGLEVQTKF
jgi:hypothetical protein